MKYNRIVKCDLIDKKNNDKVYENCYLLTYEGCDSQFEIDLVCDFMFNCDYLVDNEYEVAKVNNAIDLLNFMLNNNLLDSKNIEIFRQVLDTRKYDFKNLKNTRLNVGGGKDYVLDYELNVLGWKDEV